MESDMWLEFLKNLGKNLLKVLGASTLAIIAAGLFIFAIARLSLLYPAMTEAIWLGIVCIFVFLFIAVIIISSLPDGRTPHR